MVSLNSIILTTVTVFGVFNNYTYTCNGLESAKWDHAVNSKKLLIDALKSDSTMIEADVILGNLKGKNAVIPIMGNPPANTSDLSLKEFLENCKYLTKTTKLDFKSTEAFKAAIPIMQKSFEREIRALTQFPMCILENIQSPIPNLWLNADILPGPGLQGQPVVNAEIFIKTSDTKFPNAMLSLGWTTENCTGSNYTIANIQKMLHVVKTNKYSTKPVTYAVKASLAANSIEQLTFLLRYSPYGSTLTIWCNDKSEDLNYDGLVLLVNQVRMDRVYWDLPNEIAKKFVDNYSRVNKVFVEGL